METVGTKKTKQADWIGWGELNWEDRPMVVGVCVFGARQKLRLGYGLLQDVEGFTTRERAERALATAPEYQLPAMELVKRVNGVWCNVW